MTTVTSVSNTGAHIIGPEETVLVTGASGFAGSRVVQALLASGFKHIRCLVRTAGKSGSLDAIARERGEGSVEIILGNLLSRETCFKAAERVSVVYHLAAGVEKSYPGCFLNSVVATRNLLDAAVNQSEFKRFVNVSSIAVYSNEGIRRRGLLDETAPLEKRILERFEPYVYGKLKQDELVLDYARRHQFSYVIVRPSVIFGPGKAKFTDRVGSEFLGLFLHKGLSNRIPLTYIENCADAIVLAGLREGIDGEVFNITDDDLPTSRQFLRLYKRRVRRFFALPVPYSLWYLFCAFWEKYSQWSRGQLPPVFNRRKCAIYWKGNTYSNRKANERLGWAPKVSMSESLELYFEYVRRVEGSEK